MRVLILGLSSIAQRRGIPALRGLGCVGRIDVATRKAAGGQLPLQGLEGDLYADYQLALTQSKADLAYVSLVNSEHARWAEEALGRGFHVVVDKPAFLGLQVAERMLELADRKGVCLAEATVFGYHPQVELVNELFRAAGCAPHKMTATFSFPPLDENNFRYRRTLGGGALWDVGPYAAAAGRVFYREEPLAVSCHVLSRGGPEQVDLAFSMLSLFSHGRSLVGHFGFNTVYRNRLDLASTQLSVEFDRAFTTPPDSANEIRVTRIDGASTVAGPAGDAFAAFFAHVFESIAAGDWGELASDLHSDARTLQQLREAAGVD